jgi:hypothetical protein
MPLLLLLTVGHPHVVSLSSLVAACEVAVAKEATSSLTIHDLLNLQKEINQVFDRCLCLDSSNHMETTGALTWLCSSVSAARDIALLH